MRLLIWRWLGVERGIVQKAPRIASKAQLSDIDYDADRLFVSRLTQSKQLLCAARLFIAQSRSLSLPPPQQKPVDVDSVLKRQQGFFLFTRWWRQFQSEHAEDHSFRPMKSAWMQVDLTLEHMLRQEIATLGLSHGAQSHQEKGGTGWGKLLPGQHHAPQWPSNGSNLDKQHKLALYAARVDDLFLDLRQQQGMGSRVDFGSKVSEQALGSDAEQIYQASLLLWQSSQPLRERLEQAHLEPTDIALLYRFWFFWWFRQISPWMAQHHHRDLVALRLKIQRWLEQITAPIH